MKAFHPSIILTATALGVFLVITMSSAAPVPSSARSRSVVTRVSPQLSAEMSHAGLQFGAPVFIRIFKEPGVLEVWIKKQTKFHLFRKYPVTAFSGGLGPKLQEGDGQAPEGCYFVTPERMNPKSRFHLSFDLGYPNTYDRHHRRTGSALMVHGSCVSTGCYAMGDEAIEEIWTLCSRALESGQKFFRVHCFPFPMSEENLTRHRESVWFAFWSALQPIYGHFKKNKLPPDVTVRAGRYTINLKD